MIVKIRSLVLLATLSWLKSSAAKIDPACKSIFSYFGGEHGTLFFEWVDGQDIVNLAMTSALEKKFFLYVHEKAAAQSLFFI